MRVKIDLDVIDDAFDKFGPVPRICIDKASDPEQLAFYEKGVDAALQQLVPQRLEDMIYNSLALSMDAISHKLCLIERVEEKISGIVRISPMTNYIESLIATRSRSYEISDLIQAFSNSLGARLTRSNQVLFLSSRIARIFRNVKTGVSFSSSLMILKFSKSRINGSRTCRN